MTSRPSHIAGILPPVGPRELDTRLQSRVSRREERSDPRRSLEVAIPRLPPPRLLAFAVIPFLVPAGRPAFATEITGSITGVVRDESGAALPGATVTARGGSLPAEGRTATATGTGAYRLPLLPPGRYDLEVRLPSFGTLVRKAVEVALGAET